MMLFIKKVNFIVYLAVALVVGFGFGCLVRSNSIQDDLLAADIAKANLYNNQKSDPVLAVVEEKLRNDTVFLHNTQSAISILKERMSDLNELTEKTLAACEEIKEFKDLETTLKSLQTKAYNTNLAIETAEAGIEKVISGKSAPEYEVASNNMYIGYQRIQNQLEFGKTFVDVAKQYVENNTGENVEKVSYLIADWSLYCVQDAALNDSEEELAYWGDKVNELGSSEKLTTNEVLGVLSLGLAPYMKSNANNLTASNAANFKSANGENFMKNNAQNFMSNNAQNFMKNNAQDLTHNANFKKALNGGF